MFSWTMGRNPNQQVVTLTGRRLIFILMAEIEDIRRLQPAVAAKSAAVVVHYAKPINRFLQDI